MIRFIHVGLGDYVSAHRAVAVIQPGSVTARRRVGLARKINQYIDCSHGKGIRSYILLDEGTVIASHLTTNTLARRFSAEFDEAGDNESNARESMGSAYVVGVDPDDVDDEDLPFSDVEDDFEQETDEDDSDSDELSD